MSAAVPPAGVAATAGPSPPAAPTTSPRPLVGIAAVLLGAVISTLYGRITSFGLADLRGAVGAGYDEGAWIPTAATVAQMVIGPPAAWLGAAFGVRRVLLVSASVFGLASLLIPFAPDLPTLLAGQVVAGLASGTFIPLTIGFVLQNLRPGWWPYGIAAYGLNLELSLNIPASIEGFYLDHLSWHWIFWQGAVLAVPMILCIAAGMPCQPVNRAVLEQADGWGMLHAGGGLGLLYAALDQGNRLDWLNSGLICALLAGGLVLLAAFVARELTAERPWVNLRFLLGRNILLLVVLLALYRFVLLATAYLIPQYLQTVQNFRSLEVGAVLVWIAVPQFLLAPTIAALLGRVDPRLVIAFGVTLIGIACAMAMRLTPEWQTWEFLPSQILQAIGQSSALIAMILFFVRHLRPAEALTFGAVLQGARLFGGEVGNAFMQTWLRKAEQVDSYLVGLHVQEGTADLGQRLAGIAGALPGVAPDSPQALALLAQQVRTQATVLSIIDGFGAVVVAVVAMLLLIALLREP
ncbi:MFS transporter [Roseomonas sp. NAR14]|uniref:MFS transporter n=1 Tax=Roseomonas acroporae TaxID=2937791 RepID=A0A9X1YEY2_9PROT|nr:MFS transporter [Roseomonas acroporae]MCK8787718.1 MFS transporter [Roseomonas acroporae]